jgi:lipoprotein-releasing system ATP-binding protein
VLADEPTGNLDRSTADRTFELMLELAHAGHGLRHRHPRHRTGGRCDRVLRLSDQGLKALASSLDASG